MDTDWDRLIKEIDNTQSEKEYSRLTEELSKLFALEVDQLCKKIERDNAEFDKKNGLPSGSGAESTKLG